MIPEIPEHISQIKYWDVFPEKSQKTEPKITKKKEIISGIESILNEETEPLELFFEDPMQPRQILLLYQGDGTYIGVKILKGAIIIDNECYGTKTNKLSNIIKSLPKGKLKTLSGFRVRYE